ncbi:hypothetical protein N9F17_02365 [Salibacteraceae bacterium]|nr:hypothetical protein [Crocinitomicaceae bacterium]MCH9822079.1 hypothetical protein [Bacteroidota bacterium]MDB0058356.1 hypothetical protein [Salibacteraceae bacterium]|tara:strand:- start:26870 stop:27718 length:849 start_codon:yes stop_codon:yes gene_type:complete
MSQSKLILIGESGSTKTDWVLISDSKQSKLTTSGLNPFIVDSEAVFKTISENDFFNASKDQEITIHFYGAGCSTPNRKKTIADGLGNYFSKAEINIYHDIEAAVNSTCKDKPGIVGIIGTGSNCVYFDGKTIQYGHPSPGYLIGDEGAGSSIGKILIRDILYEIAPSDILSSFRETYKLTPAQLIDEVYNAPQPNSYIASYVQFLGKHAQHHYTEDLIHRCFSKFVKFHVVQFPEAAEAPLHLVGSIAFHFEHIINDVLDEWKIEKGQILKSPLEGLLDFHK